MAYTVNWITKRIFVPVSDMELVSGTYYRLNMTSFWLEIRRLEGSLTDGLWAPQILSHANTRTLAGTGYVPENSIINGYEVEMDPTATRVDLYGDNNNIVDVLVVNGVTVVPSNTGGNTVTTVTTGSGLDAGQDTKLTAVFNLLSSIEGTLDHADVMRLLLAAMTGKVSGAETTNISFRDLADTKDRIQATVDADGNRIAVVLDET